MDAPLTKPKVDKSGVLMKLHYITIATLVPALAFCIPHGVISSELLPALGLIPQGLGAILAVYRAGLFKLPKKNGGHEYQILLADNCDKDRKERVTLESGLLALADFVLFGGFVPIIVFSFLINDNFCRYNYWRCRDKHPMLAAYGTMPLLINCTIHAYLLFRFLHFATPEICSWMKTREQKVPLCSRCQVPIREGGNLTPEHDDDPAPSMVSAV